MEQVIDSQALGERILQAIRTNGGVAEDVTYLDDNMVNEFGKQAAQKGIRERTPNPAFVTDPLNDIKGNMDKFDWASPSLSACTFKVECHDGPKTIELIKCKSASTEDVLKEMDERGFYTAPSPYLLGLGVQHPEAIKEYKHIVSLDEPNRLPYGGGTSRLLDLTWHSQRELGLVGRFTWEDFWWFAVIRKPSVAQN